MTPPIYHGAVKYAAKGTKEGHDFPWVYVLKFDSGVYRWERKTPDGTIRRGVAMLDGDGIEVDTDWRILTGNNVANFFERGHEMRRPA
jgi:hypothetical protein